MLLTALQAQPTINPECFSLYPLCLCGKQCCYLYDKVVAGLKIALIATRMQAIQIN